MDEHKLVSSCADNFIFDDPYEDAPVTRDQLPDYMCRWNHRAQQAGSDNQWRLDYEVRQDKDNVLTDWEWWELSGTDLKGMAVVQTGDQGVLLERITYFNRNSSKPQNKP